MTGPDDSGDGMNWTIGRHPADKAEKSAVYLIRLSMDQANNPDFLDWVKLEDGVTPEPPSRERAFQFFNSKNARNSGLFSFKALDQEERAAEEVNEEKAAEAETPTIDSDAVRRNSGMFSFGELDNAADGE